jgi:hypothetical protein
MNFNRNSLRYGKYYARFEFFTVVKIQIEVFWVVTMCSDVVGYFTSACRLWQQVPPKCWHPTATLHDIKSQKTII